MQRVEARRPAALLQRAALMLAAHQQFAVDRARRRKSGGDVGEAAGHVVAGAAVEARLAPLPVRDMDDLDADAVPFPLGGIIGEVDALALQPMREHERAEHRHVGGRRAVAAPLAPGENLRIGRGEAVPHLLDMVDVERERLRERGLGESRRDADAQGPGRHLEQREPLLRVQPVEHAGERAGRIRA